MLQNQKGIKMKTLKIKAMISALLAVAFVLCTFAGCTKNETADYTVAITELVSSNSSSYNDENGSPDWFEIHNFTDKRIDLAGYKVIYTNDGGKEYIFPSGSAIGAGEYLIICCDKDAQAADGKLLAPFNLSSTGFTLELYGNGGDLIQKLPAPALTEDISYAMRSNGKFGFSAQSTPGKANDDKSIFNSIQELRGDAPVEDGLYISEVKRGDDGFIELCNPTKKAIKLSNYYLSDDASKKNKWRFPDSTLEAGAYAVAYLRGSGFTGDKLGSSEEGGFLTFNIDFKLNSEENAAYLYSSAGELLSDITFDVSMQDNISAVRTGEGIAYTIEPTPGGANSDMTFPSLTWTDMGEGDPLRLSEVLIKNSYGITDKFGDRSDWVEIHNTSDQAVSLHGYYLTDNPSKPNKWAFPEISIEAGGYLLVFCSGSETTETDELHASFNLSENDSGIYLINYNGMKRDAIEFPKGLNSDVSIGRDASGEIKYFSNPTPGKPNTSAGFAEPMGVGGFNPNYIYISETCAVNEARSGLLDWVELHNGSQSDVTLEGWHLSDSLNDFFLFDLSGITVPAGGYAVIPCSSSIKDAAPDVAPFSISPAGETLFLTDGEGGIVDVFDTGTNKVGVTSGRNEGEAERVFYATATKGAKNADTCYLSYAAIPVFSDETIYHSSAFSLEISGKNVDGTIHYTLDGSKPTESSPVYTGAIPISANAVVRAAVFVPGMLPSDTVTMTYLFDEPHEIPVVTLAMDKDDFKEVYAVSKPFVPVVERECFMQFFEKDGSLGIQTPAGVRVSGASTRAYPQKSLGLYFRSGYGRNKVTYPFFGTDYYKTFYSLVLRNAGQDYNKARIRDSFASKAMVGLNLDTSESRFVAVYINGEYWGLYDLKENMNEDFLATHFGVDPDTANVIKRNTMELEGSNADFIRVRAFAAHFDEFGGNSYVIPMTDDRYEQFKQWVDTESIMDYLIARTYLSDFDMFNQKYWRTTDYQVKWRAIFFDSDFALGSSSGNVLSHYFNVKGVPSANGSLSQMDIFCGLNSNESWRHDFIVRYIYVMKYHLNAERLSTLLDSMSSEMNTEMDRHIARWGTPSSRAAWETEIANLRKMVNERPEIAAMQLRSYYGLSESQYAQLEAEADALYTQANEGNG